MNPTAKLGIALSTTFRVEKRNRKGEITGEREFDNVVLDIGWDAFASRLQAGAKAPRHLYLGTGTTEPTAQDTGLENLSGTLPGKLESSYTMAGSDYLERRAEARLVFEYGEGEAEGVWTELGLAYGSSYTEPYNRALFRDENGNATSFTILSDEYLTVYAYLNLYLVDPDPLPSGTLDYNGQTINWVMRPITDSMARDNAGSKFEDSGGATYDYRNNMWGHDLIQKIGVIGSRVDSGLLIYGNHGSAAVSRVLGTNKFESAVFEYEPGPYDRTLTGVGFLGSGHDIEPNSLVLVDFTPSITVPKEHKMTIQKHSIEIFRAPVPTV